MPAVEEPEPAEGAPEPIRIIDEPEPGEVTAGDAVIEYTRDHLPVDMGVDTNHSDFTREQAEQLVGDIQEQLYETAKSPEKPARPLIAPGHTTDARGSPSDYPAGTDPAGTGCARTGSPPTRPSHRPATHQPHPSASRTTRSATGPSRPRSESARARSGRPSKRRRAPPRSRSRSWVRTANATACRSSRRRNASSSTRRSMT